MSTRGSLSFLAVLALVLSLAFSPVPAVAGGPADELYQTSTIDALLAGVYDGRTSLARLRQAGDFGLGTFNGLNGEMVVIDGVVYRVGMDGQARPQHPHIGTPWAEVTFFEPDITFELKTPHDMTKLTAAIDERLPSANLFYAVRVTGRMLFVKARSVPRQNKPYPRLVEVVKHQAVFNYKDMAGDLVGFRGPGYVKGVAVPGYHLHFIDAERKVGGHVLACLVGPVTVQVDVLSSFRLDLPQEGPFLKLNLTGDRSGELHKVEK